MTFYRNKKIKLKKPDPPYNSKRHPSPFFYERPEKRKLKIPNYLKFKNS